MFEHRHEPLLPIGEFVLRVVRHLAIVLLLVLGALGIGIAGYHGFEHQPWIDAIVNAAMILGGMGPVNQLHTFNGKLFAAVYALFCGLMFIVVIGIAFAPLVHRFLHRFHQEVAPREPRGQ